jgi:hypothetical protein
VITARLSPRAGIEGSRIACYRRVALDVLMAAATSVNLDDHDLIKEFKQLAAEENYYGYGMVSDILVLKAFSGVDYYLYHDWHIHSLKMLFGKPHNNLWSRSMIYGMIREMMQGKRRLLLVENLQVPAPMDVLFLSAQSWPSKVYLWPNGWVGHLN